MIEDLPLNVLVLDGELQARAALDGEATADYCQVLRDSGDEWPFPPLSVVTDGTTYWVWDGFQRHAACVEVGRGTARCVIQHGTKRDAFLLSLQANATHGARRTNADKRRAVERAMADPTLRRKGPSAVAKACGVSRQFVHRVASEPEPEPPASTHHGTFDDDGDDQGGKDGGEARPEPEGKPERAPSVRGEFRLPADIAEQAAAEFNPVIDEMIRARNKLSEAREIVEALGENVERLTNTEMGGQMNPTALGRLHSNVTEQLKQAMNELRMLSTEVVGSRPHTICIHCRGAGCEACNKKGWLSRTRYEAYKAGSE